MNSKAPVSIRQEDLVQSVADALQYISYYHPVDYIRSLAAAHEREQSPAAKDAIAQILINSRMCAEGHRPICQDTGIALVFLKVGMNVRWDDATLSLQEMVNEGVRRAYMHPENRLRASVVDDPIFARKNTKDNSPAVFHVELVPGDKVDVTVESAVAAAVAAAQTVGLDICGIDVVCDTMHKPLEEQGGGIVEVNAAPGLRMHLDPSFGKGRPVGEAIVGMMFPDGDNARIPVVAIAGTNGKTTTSRLIGRIFESNDLRVGMTSTDGVYIEGRRIDDGDCELLEQLLPQVLEPLGVREAPGSSRLRCVPRQAQVGSVQLRLESLHAKPAAVAESAGH